MFEQSCHVPMIVRVPGQPPRKVSDPVNITDWFPTVCSYMDVPVPEGLDGQSLRSLIETGQSNEHRDFAFSEYNWSWHASWHVYDPLETVQIYLLLL